MARPRHVARRRRTRGPWTLVAVVIGAGLILGVGMTVAGVMLRDASSNGGSVGAESLRNTGIAILGGVVVGTLVTLAQRALNVDLASRSASAERQRMLDLTIATRQDLRTIDLAGAQLGHRYLAGKDLSHAELGDADLRGANLRGATLRSTRLVGSLLQGADLTDADLTGADLTGANLSGAVVDAAQLQEVISDRTTILPTGVTLPTAT